MKIHRLHAWDLTPVEAVALQRELAGKVVTDVSLAACELIAGADVSYNRFSSTFYAGVVVLRLADGEVIEQRGAVADSPFPYIPGLLSFREAPALLAAFAKVESRPDAVMCRSDLATGPEWGRRRRGGADESEDPAAVRFAR